MEIAYCKTKLIEIKANKIIVILLDGPHPPLTPKILRGEHFARDACCERILSKTTG